MIIRIKKLYLLTQKIEIQHAKKNAQQTKPITYHGVTSMQRAAIPMTTMTVCSPRIANETKSWMMAIRATMPDGQYRFQL